MKNFIISLVTICIFFFITIFILKSSNTTTKPVEVRDEKTPVVEGKVIHEESTIVEENIIDEQSIVVEEKIKTESSNSLDFSDKIADFYTWKDYDKKHIDLSTDFIAIDQEGNEITKNTFLEELKTGKYIPVKLYEEDYMYQLYRINEDEKKKISKSIKSSASVTHSYFLKEDKAFPEFSFKDINGNLYTNKNTKGNILVIKCWFIQCTACIQEFPVINDLYDRYEGDDNIIFISLAFDKAKKLKEFLSKKEFRYPVVAEQKSFMSNEMEVIEYPTHLIIDKYGNIKKIVNNIDSLILALDTMVNGSLMDTDEM